jgi:hypothetical protein
MLTLEAFEKDYDSTPASIGTACCVKCGSYFSDEGVVKYNIDIHPNDAGYIDSSECLVCQGRIVHKILKPNETFKIISEDENTDCGFC